MYFLFILSWLLIIHWKHTVHSDDSSGIPLQMETAIPITTTAPCTSPVLSDHPRPMSLSWCVSFQQSWRPEVTVHRQGSPPPGWHGNRRGGGVILLVVNRGWQWRMAGRGGGGSDQRVHSSTALSLTQEKDHTANDAKSPPSAHSNPT